MGAAVWNGHLENRYKIRSSLESIIFGGYSKCPPDPMYSIQDTRNIFTYPSLYHSRHLLRLLESQHKYVMRERPSIFPSRFPSTPHIIELNSHFLSFLSCVLIKASYQTTLPSIQPDSILEKQSSSFPEEVIRPDGIWEGQYKG